MVSTISKWFYTVRHLRPVQIYGRFWFRLYRPSVNLSPEPAVRSLSASWACQHHRKPSLLHPWSFCFLNEEHSLDDTNGWDDSNVDKLWRYNLHYFDDLNAQGAEKRTEWHKELLVRWIRENPAAGGTGWEPYPTSMRIVNWIKWVLAGNTLPTECMLSLAVQTRWLLGRLERHLLGNHLFANAKALVFSGLFFKGKEAERWLEKGLEILEQEVPEQILSDGGQFERSTMYHTLALEDMLDLLNLMHAYGWEIPEVWLKKISAMRRWLLAMCHPDGDIALFNDSAFGVGPTPEQLERYALRLGLEKIPENLEGLTHLAESGYLRMQKGSAIVILDAGAIGPDYLPGHAHADTLSFEMSLFGHRLLVDTGISCYHCPHERNQQRGTAAHNTIEVDGLPSSEVWSSFRVARRAKITDLSVKTTANEMLVRATHNGYRRLTNVGNHERTWTLGSGQLFITDQIEGSGIHELRVAFHCHPDVIVEQKSSHLYELRHRDEAKAIQIKLDEQLNVDLENSTYHPEFGRSDPNFVIVGRLRGQLPVHLLTKINWQRRG